MHDEYLILRPCVKHHDFVSFHGLYDWAVVHWSVGTPLNLAKEVSVETSFAERKSCLTTFIRASA